MFQEKYQILWNRNMGGDYYKIGMGCHKGYSDARPGQFVMLRFGEQTEPLLRRPFSIHRLITENGEIKGFEILCRSVGTCTKQLSMCEKGDVLDVLGPLGNGFSVPDNIRHIFMAGGGVGIAPMIFLADFLLKKDIPPLKCSVFIGGRSGHDILCQDDFLSRGMTVHVVTDDGTRGEKGLVTLPLEKRVAKNPPDMICACGPAPMLKAVAKIAGKYDIPCQISVETLMACGMGACLGCAVESRKNVEKYLHGCMDGPVFEAGDLQPEI